MNTFPLVSALPTREEVELAKGVVGCSLFNEERERALAELAKQAQEKDMGY